MGKNGKQQASKVAVLDGSEAPEGLRSEFSPEVGPATAAAPKDAKVLVRIPAPNMGWLNVTVTGIEPYVQNKFSEKARQEMADKQRGGQRGKNTGSSRPTKERDFDEDFRQAQYRDNKGGWNGIPAAAFRAAMISACRLVNFKMTIAKMCLFVEAEGFDGSTGLVRITKGTPEPTGPMPVRNTTGVADLRNRPMWAPGWQAKLRIRYDQDHFAAKDVANLLSRAGLQVGVGEGRPDSKESAGMGWGLFTLEGTDAVHSA